MSEAHRVRVENGKYTFVRSNGYILDVFRGHEPHAMDVQPSKAIMAMMAELDAARVVMAAVRIAISCDPDGTAKGLHKAMEIYNGLVDDREPPSAWAVPEDDHPLRNVDR